MDVATPSQSIAAPKQFALGPILVAPTTTFLADPLVITREVQQRATHRLDPNAAGRWLIPRATNSAKQLDWKAKNARINGNRRGFLGPNSRGDDGGVKYNCRGNARDTR